MYWIGILSRIIYFSWSVYNKKKFNFYKYVWRLKGFSFPKDIFRRISTILLFKFIRLFVNYFSDKNWTFYWMSWCQVRVRSAGPSAAAGHTLTCLFMYGARYWVRGATPRNVRRPDIGFRESVHNITAIIIVLNESLIFLCLFKNLVLT